MCWTSLIERVPAVGFDGQSVLDRGREGDGGAGGAGDTGAKEIATVLHIDVLS